MVTRQVRTRWWSSAVLAALSIGAFVALAAPAHFLATGIQAIGRQQGWWVGDSNANDGEEVFATAIGLVGTGVGLTLVVVIGFLIVRGLGASVRFTVVSVLVSTVAVVVAHVVLALFLLRPA